MSNFSEWLKKRNIKGATNQYLDTQKPKLYTEIDRLAADAATKVRNAELATVGKDYLLNEVRKVAQRLLGTNLFALAAVELVLQAAGGAIEVKAGQSAEGLAQAILREAERLKSRVKGARL